MQPYHQTPDGITLYHGHVLDVLASLPDESVHCAVTSPPYHGLRDYGLPPSIWDDPGDCEHQWDDWQEAHDEREPDAVAGKSRSTDRFYGDESRRFNGNHQKHTAGQFCRHCASWRGQLGLEPTVDAFVTHLVEVFRHVKRVLRSDGTCFLNIGDSYAGGGHGPTGKGSCIGNQDYEKRQGFVNRRTTPTDGLKPKDLCLVPFRLALALQADGWWVRQTIIWSKPNPMPESVVDRPTTSHEYIFLLAKAGNYFFNQDAVRELQSPGTFERFGTHGRRTGIGPKQTNSPNGMIRDKATMAEAILPNGRNIRSVWTTRTQATPEAHFATYPEELVRRCLLAASSERGVCPECGAPWRRLVERKRSGVAWINPKSLITQTGGQTTPRLGPGIRDNIHTLGWTPSCRCNRPDTVPATVLDPFAGSCTTLVVARQLGRRGIGIDLSETYLRDIGIPRLEGQTPSLLALPAAEPSRNGHACEQLALEATT